METGSLTKTLDDDDFVLSVAFSHDSSLLASGSTVTIDYGILMDMGPDHNGTIKVWDVATGTLLHTLERHGTFVYGVAFSHDSKLIAAGADSWTVRIWDTTTWESIRSVRCDGNVTSVAFSHDSKLLASGSSGSVKIWDMALIPKSTKEIDVYKGKVNAVAFSDNSELVASASEDEMVKLWDPTTGSLQHLMMSINMARSVTFSNDLRLVVFGNWGEI